jgi:hypothetical protein
MSGACNARNRNEKFKKLSDERTTGKLGRLLKWALKNCCDRVWKWFVTINIETSACLLGAF